MKFALSVIVVPCLRAMCLLTLATVASLQAQVAANPARSVSSAWREGRPAVVWPVDSQSMVELDLAGAATNTNQTLELWMRLPARSASGKVTVLAAGRAAELSLSWTGWRRLVLPIALMKPADTQGFDMRKVRLVAEGEFPAETVIYVQDARIIDQSAGPGLTERDLLEHIDLDRPDLSDVRKASEAGRTDLAMADLAAHFRQDFTSRLSFGGSGQERAALLAGADRLLAGEIELGNNRHVFPQGNIDWKLNPTKGRAASTAEWVFSINRHAHWETLARAYRVSGNDKYAELWARQLRGWVAQMPAPAVDEERAGSGWRGLESGLRQSRAWPATFFALAGSKAVKDADILLFLRSVIDHGNFLTGHPYAPGNHFILAMCGLYTQGVVFPELKDASLWRRHALEQLGLSLDRNVLPEGAWMELSPGYHQWVVTRTLLALSTARRNGYGGEVPSELLGKLQKMAEWPVRLAGPDGIVPTVNDGGKVVLADSVAPTAEIFPASIPVRWATGFRDGTNPPAPEGAASYLLPDSGYAIMRTGWDREASYALFDVGPLGGWHGHQDALNLVTYFYGRPFLFDNGGWAYDTSIWRKYGTATASHNTVLVDGLGQYRGTGGEAGGIGANSAATPPPRFGSNEKIDYASGWFTGNYGTKARSQLIARHHREVAFVKSSAERPTPLMVVVDTLTPADQEKHRYEVRWHVLGTQWKEDRAARCLWTTDAGRPNLAILALDGAEEFHADSGVKTPEVLGWSYDGQTGGPYPALTVRQAVTDAGVKRFVTVLVPYRGEPGNPVASVRRDDPQTWTITCNGQPPLTVHLEDGGAADAPGFSIIGLPWPDLSP